MFGLQFKGKTIDEALMIIDNKFKELSKEMDETYSKLEGYAKSKDIYEVRSCIRSLDSLENTIRALGYLRTDIEYM